MEAYDVKIYPTAKQDLNDIISYLNTLSPDTATQYYDFLVEEIASLSQLPDRCPRVKDPALLIKGYRYLVVKNYLVFYVISGSTVQIRRILYGKRDYQALL